MTKFALIFIAVTYFGDSPETAEISSISKHPYLLPSKEDCETLGETHLLLSPKEDLTVACIPVTYITKELQPNAN